MTRKRPPKTIKEVARNVKQKTSKQDECFERFNQANEVMDRVYGSATDLKRPIPTVKHIEEAVARIPVVEVARKYTWVDAMCTCHVC